MTEQQREKILEAACEICRWPYVCKNEEELMEHCDVCPIQAAVDKQTNGEKIRSMPDEELATFLHGFRRNWNCRPYKDGMTCGEIREKTGGSCRECYQEWVKREAVDNGKDQR